MITDSHRIIDRTWRRPMPTERSSPISRVRSWIDKRQRVRDADEAR